MTTKYRLSATEALVINSTIVVASETDEAVTLLMKVPDGVYCQVVSKRDCLEG
tara:strand:- start:64585 stop:64743 length:159 start_codon:yes stop_codon:yes gene_type:complete